MLLYVVAIAYAALRAVLTWGLLRRQAVSAEQPRVSVIVAVRNEATRLPRLLESLAAQIYPSYEVIVVDDRSTDRTPDLIQAWSERDTRIQHVRVADEPMGRSPKIEALALGARHATGDLLLFTDGDCWIAPGWIRGMAALFTPDVGAVIGYAELDAPHDTLVEQVQVFDYFAMMMMAAGATKLGWPIGAAGAAIAYRRSAYQQVGGFEALGAEAVSDDMALIQRIIDHTSYRVAFCDDQRAVVRSQSVPTVRQFLEQRLRWFAGGVEVLHVNKPLVVISGLLGLFNGMLLSFPVFLRRHDLRRVFLSALAIRLVADVLSYAVAARHVQRMKFLALYPLWLPVQILMTNLLPLASVVRDWRWKQ